MIGYDKLSLNHQLLLGLTFEEMTGAITRDRAKPVHPFTLNGGTIAWGSLANGLPLIVLTGGTPDYLECVIADTGDLDFTTGDFSVAAWVCLSTLATSHIFCRCDATGGWYFQLNAGSQLRLATWNGGVPAHIDSAVGEVTINNWWLVGASRSGLTGQVFLNGNDVTDVAVAQDCESINADLHLGVWNNHILNPLDGRIAGGPCGPRIWGRYLAESEHRRLFHMTRDWVGI